jgi:hypothetical protein
MFAEAGLVAHVMEVSGGVQDSWPDEAQACAANLKEVSSFLNSVVCVDASRFRTCQDASHLEHAWQVRLIYRTPSSAIPIDHS